MNNTIIISDTHAPFHHRDTIPFLSAVKDAYGIVDAKHVGDVVDNHNSSYHEIEYGILSSEHEHRQAKKFIKQLEVLFPDLTISLGNHDNLTPRKAKTAGIPQDHLGSYNDIYDVNWNWVDKDYFTVSGKNDMCLMTHAISPSTLNNAKIHSHNSIQGHYHGVMGIEYFADTERLRWSMSVGCLVDTHSSAFNYASSMTSKRPLIGLGAIIENQPVVIPMPLKKSGRWTGVV